ncbi:dihydropyrimidinase [Thermodesulfobacteriota bacterium]
MDTIIKNGTIVNADSILEGDVLIQHGIIAHIGKDLQSPGTEVIDATDRYVMPGGVDVHTHLNMDIGIAVSQDDFFTGTKAASFGGTTCIVDYPGFGPEGCNLNSQILLYHGYARDNAVIDYAFHGIFQHVNHAVLDEIKTIVSEGIPSFKGYLTYDYGLKDLDVLSLLDAVSISGGLFAVHAENDDIIRFMRDRFLRENKTSPRYHAMSRPERCEAEAVNRMIQLAATAGNAPLYIVHLSTAMGLDSIKTARAEGQHVFAETCPQYLFLNEERYDEPEYNGLKYIMSPPLRTKKNSSALWEGIIEGHIDVIATDHCPFDFSKKLQMGKDNFTKCPGGIPGIELRIPLMFSEGVMKERIPLNRFVEITATAPARIMGLHPRKGEILEGADADIIIINPNHHCVVTHEMLHENVDFTPYEGMKLQGWPELTMVRGRTIVKDGIFYGEKGYGEFIKRKIKKIHHRVR